MGALIDMMLFSSISYLLYCILPKSRMPFAARRMYLLLSTIMSASVPFIHIPIRTESVPEILKKLSYYGTLPSETAETLLTIYLVVAACLFISLTVQLARFVTEGKRRTVREYEYKGYKVKELDNKGTSAYSFIGCIHISADLPAAEKAMILEHEASHLRHRHTWEKLLMHIMKILMWFNPFVHLAEIHLDEVQECEADCDVLKSGADRKEYVSLILDQILAKKAPSFTSEFHNSLTRKRFEAMLNPPSDKAGFIRYSYMMPVVFLLIFSAEFTEASQTKGEMLRIPSYSEDNVMQSDTSESQIIISTDKASRTKSKDTRIEPEDNIILIIK